MQNQNKIFKFLKIVRLGWAVPLILLLSGKNPKKQLQELSLQLLVPLSAIALFLGVWHVFSTKIETKLGTIPGPGDVVSAFSELRDEVKREKQKAEDFYIRQEERNKVIATKFPDREITAKKYSGKETYYDQIGTSLITVFSGFIIASIVAIPLGLLCGLSKTINTALNPFIQIFKPVSPLAWLPIVWLIVGAMYTAKDPLIEISFINSALTVALCSLWPTLVNTAVGVSSVEKDYLNVARVLRLSWFKKVQKVIIPSALPYIFTGLRLSLGVGWMVLIAAEMLAQNPGLGKFVWDMFQNGSSQTLAMIMVAVFTIGIIGYLLDTIMLALQQLVSFEENAV